jgi:hypothetical protein
MFIYCAGQAEAQKAVASQSRLDCDVDSPSSVVRRPWDDSKNDAAAKDGELKDSDDSSVEDDDADEQLDI